MQPFEVKDKHYEKHVINYKIDIWEKKLSKRWKLAWSSQ